MSSEAFLHCSALLMVDYARRELRGDSKWRGYLIARARALKRDYQHRPVRGYRDEEPATGVFLSFDAGLRLSRLMRESGFEAPAGHQFEDRSRDVCFHLKYAPGRKQTSDPRGTRYEITPCDIGNKRPLEFFQSLRQEILGWTDPEGSCLFDQSSQIFIVGARPLPMLDMFTVLQPHHFAEAFPESQVVPAGPQSGNLLFVQLQDESLSRWAEAGGAGRRRAMGGLFTSTVLAPGDSYSLEFAAQPADDGSLANLVVVDEETAGDPRGLGYICRIHDGFAAHDNANPFKIEMRDSFLPGIERPDIVSRFCNLRESEMAAVRFTGPDDAIRITRGGISIAEFPLSGGRSREQDGLVGEAEFDPRTTKLTIRLPFLFFPDLEIPRRLLAGGVVIEWINEHREEARHTISFWPGEHSASHRSQALRALNGRLVVKASYLGSGRARAGLDNILVYRDDFSVDAANRMIAGATDSMKLGDLTKPFNSVFTGRTPDTEDALTAFVEMMISLLRREPGESSKGVGAGDSINSPNGIAPFVRSQYSFVFREPGEEMREGIDD